jgi:predicted transcriptional regulator
MRPETGKQAFSIRLRFLTRVQSALLKTRCYPPKPWRGWRGNAGTQATPVDNIDSRPYTDRMEVHFTPEQEAQLSQIASHAGTDTERLVKDAVLRLLEQDARFRAAIREGIAQADRGEFIEEEEMDARIERMLNS